MTDDVVKLKQELADAVYGWDAAHRENELLRAALREAVAYADAAAQEEGMPGDKQCKRLTIREIQLIGKPTPGLPVEWDVAAARKLISSAP
jgi:hypothetical protein